MVQWRSEYNLEGWSKRFFNALFAAGPISRGQAQEVESWIWMVRIVWAELELCHKQSVEY